MNVSPSIECMVFTMSVKEDTMLEYGENLAMCSMFFPSPQLLTIEFSVCMEDLVLT